MSNDETNLPEVQQGIQIRGNSPVGSSESPTLRADFQRSWLELIFEFEVASKIRLATAASLDVCGQG